MGRLRTLASIQALDPASGDQGLEEGVAGLKPLRAVFKRLPEM